MKQFEPHQLREKEMIHHATMRHFLTVGRIVSQTFCVQHLHV